MDVPRDEEPGRKSGAGDGDGQAEAAGAAVGDGVRASGAGDEPVAPEPESEMTLPTRASEPDQVTMTGHGANVAGDRGDEPPLLPPHTLVGRYIVLGHLGSGGMGVVYKAYDPDLNRQIALKLVRVVGSGGGDPVIARSRLLREAQGLAQLSHPNVVSVYDVGLFDDGVFLAMELVSGPTLREWLKTDPSLRDKLRVFLAAGEGLEAAHRAGLVHRDFKPANVILGEDGRPRVLDFGLVRAVGEGVGEADAGTGAPDGERRPISASGEFPVADALLASHASLATGTESRPGASLTESSDELSAPLTLVGAVVGTPRYMSPEQLLGRAVDAKTDQFSFCVALYQAVYGKPPFRSKTLRLLREDVCAGRVRPPPAGVRVPARLRRAILKGLAPDPDERHPSMAELLGELARDSARVWRHRLAIAAMIVSLGLGAYAAIAGRDARGVALCQSAPDELAAVWNPQRRQAVEQAFVGSGVSYAADTFERVGSALDDYGQAWAQMRTEACEATHLRGVQSDTVLDLRMGCLDRKLRSLQSLVTVFADQPDREVVTYALDASLGLGGLAICADAEALEREEPWPERPEDREALEELRAELDAVAQLNSLGKYQESEARLDELAIRAQALDFPPLAAELAYYKASTLEFLGRYAEAEPVLKEAIELAIEWGMDELAARAQAEATYLVGYRLQRHAEGRVYALHARAHTRGLGDPLEAEALVNLAIVYRHEGKYAEAEELHKRALAVWERALGPDHPDVAVSLNNLAMVYVSQGKYVAAERLHTRSFEIRKKALGPEHPHVAVSLSNLGMVQLRQQKYAAAEKLYRQATAIRENALGPDHPLVAVTLRYLAHSCREQAKYADAEAFYKRAIAIREKAYGAVHPQVSWPLVGLALTYEQQRRFADALPVLERARAIREQAEVEPDQRAQVAFVLARVLAALGKSRSRSRSLAEQALALYQAAGAETERLEVERWLARDR